MPCRRETGHRDYVTGEYKFLSIWPVKYKNKLMFRMFLRYNAKRFPGKPSYAFDLIRQQKPRIYGYDHNYC